MRLILHYKEADQRRRLWPYRANVLIFVFRGLAASGRKVCAGV